MSRSALLKLSGSALVLLLAACGGGGGDAGVQPPVVTLSTTSSVKYGETMLVTLTGVRLDQALTLESTGCRNFARSTTAPNVSSATTAYYTCTTSGTGNRVITVSGAGQTVATVNFAVPVPQVSMVVGNGSATLGTLVLTLTPEQAPLTVDNFLAYVKGRHYDGTVIHRHVPGFVLQGGGYLAPVTTGGLPAHIPERAPIALEDNAGLSNLRLTVAMARTGIPDSATSEFFINLADNTGLDRNPTTGARGYAVFGNVTAGSDVVTAMAAAPCSAAGFLAAGECLPVPNLRVTNVLQTR